jgi:hypothetical protein
MMLAPVVILITLPVLISFFSRRQTPITSAKTQVVATE